MTRRHDRKTARREALALAVALLSFVAAVVIMQQRPVSHDELKISFETLRSQAAQLAVLFAQAADAEGISCISPTAALPCTAPA